MTQISEIITLTDIDAELFENSKGEFPTLLTFITLTNPDDIVKHAIRRMLDFFDDYSEPITVDFAFAAEIVHADDSKDTLTPATLGILVQYNEDQERMIILELADSIEHFSIH